MELPMRPTTSSDDCRSFETEEERRVYQPTFAKTLEKTETVVRPVSSRSYQQLLTSGETLQLYGNDLYSEEKHNSRSFRPRSSPVRESSSKTLQTLAEKQRAERMQGGYNVSIVSSKAAQQAVELRASLSRSRESSLGETTSASSSKATSWYRSLASLVSFRVLSVSRSPTKSSPKTGDEITSCISDSIDESTEAELVQGPIARILLPTHPTSKEMQRFLMIPGGHQQLFNCYILRDRSRSKTYPVYRLFADEGGVFLLSARRRKKSKSSNYLVSLVDGDLSRGSVHYFGKVRSNFIGTQFTIYDKGDRPEPNTRCLRSELGVVLYEHNIFGTKGPRKMTAVIPKVFPNGQIARFQPTAPKDSIFCKYNDTREEENLMSLVNKAPRWNDQLSAYCLNFKGRVTEASVKNFQLVTEDDPERVVLQFGKVGKDRFNMDFAWPVSAFQAFSICLTSFDSKLACE